MLMNKGEKAETLGEKAKTTKSYLLASLEKDGTFYNQSLFKITLKYLFLLTFHPLLISRYFKCYIYSSVIAKGTHRKQTLYLCSLYCNSWKSILPSSMKSAWKLGINLNCSLVTLDLTECLGGMLVLLGSTDQTS